MKIMVLGSGGREHALACAFLKNRDVEKIYCVPGNGGTEDLERCENVNLRTIDEIVRFGGEKGVSLAMPGSEATLVEGIVDRLTDAGIKAFGPDRKAAMLEGSKAFAKDFMNRFGVRTAEYRKFSSYGDALEYLSECSFPIVIKADGLAAGKGVIICRIREEAEDALKLIMVDKHFGSSGDRVVIEEFLEGFEASIHCFFDGKTFLPLLSAKDHKKIGEGERGPNTGGMGVVAPNPWMTDELWEDFNKNILSPTQEGLLSEGLSFQGVIFFGVLVQNGRCYLLEYNMRMGDPEIQGMLSLLDSDFTTLVTDTLSGKLENTELKWKEGSACCVVLASEGYPGSYRTGYEIKGITSDISSNIYMAGVQKKEGIPVTSGGRVLSVTAVGSSLEEARSLCYRDVEKISFEGKTFRKDIGP